MTHACFGHRSIQAREHFVFASFSRQASTRRPTYYYSYPRRNVTGAVLCCLFEFALATQSHEAHRKRIAKRLCRVVGLSNSREGQCPERLFEIEKTKVFSFLTLTSLFQICLDAHMARKEIVEHRFKDSMLCHWLFATLVG